MLKYDGYRDGNANLTMRPEHKLAGEKAKVRTLTALSNTKTRHDQGHGAEKGHPPRGGESEGRP